MGSKTEETCFFVVLPPQRQIGLTQPKQAKVNPFVYCVKLISEYPLLAVRLKLGRSQDVGLARCLYCQYYEDVLGRRSFNLFLQR